MSTTPSGSPASAGGLRRFTRSFSAQNNILTYVNGQLRVVPYYRTRGGSRPRPLVADSLIWRLWEENPDLSSQCFHSINARTFKNPKTGDFIAACGHGDGPQACNFWLNFTQISENRNGLLEVEEDLPLPLRPFPPTTPNPPATPSTSLPRTAPEPSPSKKARTVRKTARMTTGSKPPHRKGSGTISTSLSRPNGTTSAPLPRRQPTPGPSSSATVPAESASAPVGGRRAGTGTANRSILDLVTRHHHEVDLRRDDSPLRGAGGARGTTPDLDFYSLSHRADFRFGIPLEAFQDMYEVCWGCRHVMTARWIRFHVCDLTK